MSNTQTRLAPTTIFDKHIIGEDLKNGSLIYDFDACVEAYMKLNPSISNDEAEAALIVDADGINEGDDLDRPVVLLKRYSNPKHARPKTLSKSGREILGGFDDEDDRILLENRDYLDQAVVGELANSDKVFVYDYALLIEAMCEETEEWTVEDAIEWIDYNTLGTYVEKYPLVADMDISVDDMDLEDE